MNESRPLVQRIWDFFDMARSNETYLTQICHRFDSARTESFIHKLCVFLRERKQRAEKYQIAYEASVLNRAFDN